MAPGQYPLPVNQYFHYNPVTGLNYYSGQCCFEVTTVDPNLTQKDYNQIIEEWIHYAYEFGIALVNSTKVKPFPKIISNFNISLTKF